MTFEGFSEIVMQQIKILHSSVRPQKSCHFFHSGVSIHVFYWELTLFSALVPLFALTKALYIHSSICLNYQNIISMKHCSNYLFSSPCVLKITLWTKYLLKTVAGHLGLFVRPINIIPSHLGPWVYGTSKYFIQMIHHLYFEPKVACICKLWAKANPQQVQNILILTIIVIIFP